MSVITNGIATLAPATLQTDTAPVLQSAIAQIATTPSGLGAEWVPVRQALEAIRLHPDYATLHLQAGLPHRLGADGRRYACVAQAEAWHAEVRRRATTGQTIYAGEHPVAETPSGAEIVAMRDVADAVGFTLPTLYRWCRLGMPHYRDGSGTRFAVVAEVTMWHEDRAAEVGTPGRVVIYPGQANYIMRVPVPLPGHATTEALDATAQAMGQVQAQLRALTKDTNAQVH